MKKKQQTLVLPSTPWWQKHTLLLLCGAAFLVYANTIGHGYNMDDELVTRKHKLTSKGIGAIPEIFTSPYYSDNMGYAYEYRPVVLTSFAIEHQFFGDKPAVSHFFNVLLYVLTVVVLYKLLRKLLHAYSYWLSVLVVLVFALHPLHTEVVASIKNRDEILALLGALGAWWFALGFAEKGKWWQAALVSLLFLGGALSKMSIVPCLVFIPLSLVFFTDISGRRLLLIGLLMAVPVYPFLSLPGKSDVMFLLIYIAATFFPWFFFQLKKKFFANPGEAWQGVRQRVRGTVRSNMATVGDATDASPVLRPMTLKREELLRAPFGAAFFLLLFGFGFYMWQPSDYLPVLWLLLFGLVFFAANHSQRNLLLPVFTAMFLAVCYFSMHSLYIDLGLVFLLFVYLLHTQMRNVLLLLCILSFAPFYFYFERFSDFFVTLVPFVFLALRDKNRFFSGFIYVIVFSAALIVLTDFSSVLFQGAPWGSVLTNIIVYGLILLASLKKGVRFFIPLSLLLFIPFLHLLSDGDKHAIPAEIGLHEEKPKTAAAFYSLAPEEQRPILFAEMPVTSDSPLEERLGLAADVMGFYLKKMLFPYPLGYYYGYAFFEPISLFEMGPLLSLFIHLTLLVLAFLFIRKYPPLSFGILFYLGSIVLFSGLLYPVVGVAGDRFSYMATLGWAFALAYLLVRFLGARKTWPEVSVRPAFWGTVLGICLVYATMTIVRNMHWKDSLTLMGHDIAYLDESAQAHNLYALNLMRESMENRKLNAEKRLEYQKLAVFHFERAVEIWPAFFNAAYDKGRASLIIGDYASAIDGFEKAVAIGPSKGFVEPYLQLSQLYLQTGRYKEYLRNAKLLLIERSEAETYNMVARGFYMTGQNDSAKLYLHKGMAMFPHDNSLRKNLAEIFKTESKQDSVDYYMR